MRFAQSLASASIAVAVLLTSFARGEDGAATPTPGSDQVVLKSGDVLRGRIVESTEGVLVFEHPELGPMRISLEKVSSYGPAVPALPASGGATNVASESGDTATSTVSASPKPQSSADEIEADKTGQAIDGWDFYVSFAFAGTSNVNDEFSVRGGAGARHENERTKTTIDIEYYFRVLNSETTDNNLLANAVQEWNFGQSPWLFFVQGQYQYDELQAWQQRVSLYTGPGYRLIRGDVMQLTLRLGAGATYEAGNVDDWKPELLLAQDFAWQISERQLVAFDASIAPNVEDFSEYRIQAQLEYALALTGSKRGLALTLGLREIYDSRPDPGSVSSELRIYGGLKYGF